MYLLERDGLTNEVLMKLSYKTSLDKKLKNNLHHFNREELFKDIQSAIDFYNESDILDDIAVEYRVKSIQSVILKYERYYPDRLVSKVYNDILGFRAVCDSYDDILHSVKEEHLRIVDMSKGKANDDGYRGVHIYFQVDNFHYPIEIQYNTFFDRQMNNWLHKYIYKRNIHDGAGSKLRYLYEGGKIRTETEFKEELKDVLSCCKEI